MKRDNKGRFISNSKYIKSIVKEAKKEYEKDILKDKEKELDKIQGCIREGIEAPSVCITPSLTNITITRPTLGNKENNGDILEYTPHSHENLTFYKILSWLSVFTSASMAYLSNWQYETLLTRFEYLRWLLFGHHPGMK